MRRKDKKRSEMTEEELAKAREYHARWNRENRKKNHEKVLAKEREYDKKNRERRRERDRKAYHKDGAGKAKAAKRREEHGDELREYQRLRMANNPELHEKHKQHCKDWAKAHPGRIADANTLRTRRRFKKKLQCLEYLGNVCNTCGTDNPHVMEFHHRNPEEKSFMISGAIKNKKLEDILPELDKCILLCANCHRIEHVAEWLR